MSEKVTLTGEKETLLVTLFAKAEESRLPDSLLRDRFAAMAVAGIDYDFASLCIDRDLMIGLALRADILDRWTRDFIARHPTATVLHIGCGLDSRVFRIDPPAGVRWFDVDYPEVVDLRRKLYPDREGYRLIGSSVTQPDWLGEVPSDQPMLVIAEGLLPYLAGNEVPHLLGRLAGHAPSGEQIFDAYSRLGLRLISLQPSIRATGAALHWALDDPHDLERQVPGLTLATCLSAHDPEGYDPAQIARMSWLARVSVWAFALVPAIGNIGWLLRYRF